MIYFTAHKRACNPCTAYVSSIMVFFIAFEFCLHFDLDSFLHWPFLCFGIVSSFADLLICFGFVLVLFSPCLNLMLVCLEIFLSRFVLVWFGPGLDPVLVQSWLYSDLGLFASDFSFVGDRPLSCFDPILILSWFCRNLILVSSDSVLGLFLFGLCFELLLVCFVFALFRFFHFDSDLAFSWSLS